MLNVDVVFCLCRYCCFAFELNKGMKNIQLGPCY
jgi:hypothetical protein